MWLPCGALDYGDMHTELSQLLDTQGGVVTSGQALQFLSGGADMKTLRERGIAATRQLAKRQLTWLRSTEATRFDTSSLAPEAIADAVVASIRTGMTGSPR